MGWSLVQAQLTSSYQVTLHSHAEDTAVSVLL
jgi:hypothetical protein